MNKEYKLDAVSIDRSRKMKFLILLLIIVVVAMLFWPGVTSESGSWIGLTILVILFVYTGLELILYPNAKKYTESTRLTVNEGNITISNHRFSHKFHCDEFDVRNVYKSNNNVKKIELRIHSLGKKETKFVLEGYEEMDKLYESILETKGV